MKYLGIDIPITMCLSILKRTHTVYLGLIYLNVQ